MSCPVDSQGLLEIALEDKERIRNGRDDVAGLKATKNRAKKAPTYLVRDGGKSLLPFSRVQKIIKADKASTFFHNIQSLFAAHAIALVRTFL